MVSLLALAPGLARAQGEQPAQPLPADAALIARAKQLLLVQSADWDQAQAGLQRFARPRPGAPFIRVGAPLLAWVGRAGMAWRSDRDEVTSTDAALGPRKREGDGRSPAGVFALGELWGYAATPPKGVRWPYHAIDDRDRCVDDPDSPDYNQLRRAPLAGAEPWRSAERLRLPTDHYKLLLTIDYNHLVGAAPAGPHPQPRPRPRAGSCIFLHIAPPPGAGTAGCTALSEADLRRILAWLDPKGQPLLILLPVPARQSAAERFQLPAELFQP